jgi:serine/threonine protein kinase
MDNFNELRAGYVLQGGTYLVERTIGADDFGITYMAKNTSLSTVCAVKEFFISGCCLRNAGDGSVSLSGMDAAEYEKRRQKFIENAQTLARLDHPGVVKATDIFAENNTAYMAMPFVEGTNLQNTVEQGGKLSYDRAANYIAQLSEALGYIHGEDMLHGNIKPENIIITPDDRVVLINFNLMHEPVGEKTQNSSFILTQSYASPEQYRANGRRRTWSDVYSLGAVCYFALTGQKPVSAAARAIETMSEPQTLVPSVPVAANRAIMKAMELKPENRHQTVQEFMRDLSDNTAKVRSSQETARTDNPTSGKTGERKTNVLGWIFAAVAVILGIAVVYLMRQQTSVQNQLDIALSENEALTSQLSDANNTLNSITEISPAIISDIKIGVLQKDGTVAVEHGKTIYSSQTKYLSPSITGISLTTILGGISIKFYNAYRLIQGSGSPDNFTYSYEFFTPSGSFQNKIVGGWGSDTSGTWPSGEYRVEVWYAEKCIGLKYFRIH